MNNCGNCNDWTPAQPDQKRENSEHAMCLNRESSNYNKITVHADGCGTWKPIDMKDKVPLN